MKNILICLISSVTFLANIVVGEETRSASCIELTHTDNTTKNICDKKNKKYLILEFFSPSCGACTRNIGPFKRLEQETSSVAHSRLVSLGGLQQTVNFLNSHAIAGDVAVDSSKSARAAYNISRVPTIIIIDQNSNIVHQYLGVLIDSEIEYIRNLVSR